MDTGERLKFLRIFWNVNQTDLASLISVSQRDIVLYEKNKLQLKQPIVEIISQYFECKPNYLLYGDIPAFEKFGFLSIPNAEIYNSPLPVMRRKIADLKKNMYLLRAFLDENVFKKYFVARLTDAGKKFGNIYIFMSDVHEMLFFVKVSPEFFENIENDVIFPFNLHEISNTEVSPKYIHMFFDLPRLMFLLQDPALKIETIKLLSEKLSLPKKDKVIADFIDYATNYTVRFSSQAQKIQTQFIESKAKEIADIMKKYNIKLSDIEKYL